jgi:hypothetical protein
MELIDDFCSDESLDYISNRVCNDCLQNSEITMYTGHDQLRISVGVSVSQANICMRLDWFKWNKDEMELGKFLDEIGEKDCSWKSEVGKNNMLNDTFAFHDYINRHSISYEIRYVLGTDLLLIGLTSNIIQFKKVIIGIPYSINKESIDNALESFCISAEGEFYVIGAKIKRVDEPNALQYRNIINYLGEFACRICSNNIGARLILTYEKNDEFKRPILLIRLSEAMIFFIKLIIADKRSNANNYDELAKLKALFTAQKVDTELVEICVFYTRFIYAWKRKELTISVHNTWDIEAKVTISYAQHKASINRFIDIWMAYLKL